MSKLTLEILCLIGVYLIVTSYAFPSQYQYNYPPRHSRFAGWTVTSQELLALPSTNDNANIVRVAPPPGFVRSYRTNRARRRSRRSVQSEMSRVPHFLAVHMMDFHQTRQ